MLPMASVMSLQGMKQAGIAQGQSVLINSAPDGMGAFAVQIAKTMETEVTGVCSTGFLTPTAIQALFSAEASKRW